MRTPWPSCLFLLMGRLRDKNIIYDKVTTETDSTGVYTIYWYDGERVAIKRQKDFSSKVLST